MSASPIFIGRVGVIAICTVLAACSGKSSARADSGSTNGSVASTDSAAAATTMIRGTVASVSATALAVQGDTGTTNVQLVQPLRVYERQPARLDEVTPNTFVGVTTVKQPDGRDQATEIHIFPEELRGLGEGSRPMAPAASSGGPGSTMTNGTMSNGNASNPQMSNGSASRAGSTLVVQYAGGSMKADVPANTPVTKLVATSTPLAAGDRIVVVATKRPDGSLESNRIVLAK